MDTLTSHIRDIVHEIYKNQPLVVGMVNTLKSTNPKVLEQISFLKENSLVFIKRPFKYLGERLSKPIPSIEKPLVLELKTLQPT